METVWVWLVLAAVLIVSLQNVGFAYLVYRYKRGKLDTILRLAEQAGHVDNEVLVALGHQNGPTADMRKGLVWLALGVPVFVGLLMLENAATAIFIGGIPVLLGIAYLVVRAYGHAELKS